MPRGTVGIRLRPVSRSVEMQLALWEGNANPLLPEALDDGEIQVAADEELTGRILDPGQQVELEGALPARFNTRRRRKRVKSRENTTPATRMSRAWSSSSRVTDTSWTCQSRVFMTCRNCVKRSTESCFPNVVAWIFSAIYRVSGSALIRAFQPTACGMGTSVTSSRHWGPCMISSSRWNLSRLRILPSIGYASCFLIWAILLRCRTI